MKRRTTLVRMDREFVKNIRMKWPNIPVGHILQVSYRTSAVRAEGIFRKKNVKK